MIAVVDSKVNEHEQRRRLKEFHARMDSKSIMMMKSGQIFAKEDLLRRRLIHDGVLHLKSNQARLKGKEGGVYCWTSHLVLCLFIQTQMFNFLIFYRGPCSAFVRCLCLPPRERPEIYLCNAGRSLPLSLSSPCHVCQPTIAAVSIHYPHFFQYLTNWLQLIKLLLAPAATITIINQIL